jgi:hypothetical protein
MNARLESLAREREHLLQRSALCRLRLARDVHALRGAVTWRHVPQALATQPVLRTAAWSLALSMIGVERAARVLMLAGRVILVVKLARAAIGYARGPVRT